MARERMTPEEIKEMNNLNAARLQEAQWKARNYDPRWESQAREIAEGFNGQDVSLYTLQAMEGKTGIFSGYVASALKEMGYSQFEDNSRRPSKTAFTMRRVCVHCGRPLPPDFCKEK